MMNLTDILKNNISVHSLIESMSEGIIFTNKEGEILSVNETTNQLFGYKRNELIGQPIENLIPNRFRDKHKTHLLSYFSAPKVRPMGHANSKLSGTKKDGTIFSLEISLSFINTDKELLAIAFITDISSRVKAENELKIRNIELDAFAHTIAHELHSQLNSIIGFSQLILNDNDLSEQKRSSFLDMIVASSLKMNSIIREMLLFSSLKKDEIVKTQLSMKNIVDEAVNRIADSEKKSAKISISDDFEPSLGYGPWIEEVWYNYIRNALKYGGTPPSIEIGSSKAKDGYNKFWVKDNGKGLTKKQCDIIFVDPQKLGNGFIRGHGLGLSIVKQIVQKLNGWVTVESTPNKGSRFSFYLPHSENNSH
ncbi:PAS domain-containing sensor histidine kinase [Labilibaculum sp. K2S]|uniref:PAS domain-containing sensor histidine kinase n=1 Tax=Labilibaculum sp. K2S TaxID=3056386 RepID=UPI0025A4A144|nr:PAS domain-containing sensor histidine kinase [Labilibaculum sp. K2S]MDM8158872.1 PAS domain-containing sensor histidine kinase [Labilibaculum sp. K2S]